jgi:glutaredoxin
MHKELVMYSRTTGCGFVRIAKQVLKENKIPYREVLIDEDPQASLRVKIWTGFLSVPTLVITRPGEIVPITEPMPITPNNSPRGINRGSMISEASARQLLIWLQDNDFVPKDTQIE